jgi:membrane protein DedA with SNARE-associated domain/rhodanese-related sulfurtransferase
MTESTHFFISHGLTVIFVVVFVERLGLPIPALPWLLGAGALAAAGRLNPFLAVGVTMFGCVLGDSVWFYLGRSRGTQVLGWLCRISLEPDSCVRRTQNVFTRYGLRGLLVANFVPGLGTVAPPLAGMAGIPFGRFLLVDGLGALAYAACGVGIGFFFSGEIGQIAAALAQIGVSALITLVATVALYVAYKFWQRRRLLRELRGSRITVQELRQQLEAGAKPIILDLRSRAELKLDPSIIRGAIHIDVDRLAPHSHPFPQDQDIVVYCSCPNEVSSARFARMLQKRGFTHIRPLQGGIAAWRKLEYPTETWSSTVTATTGAAIDSGSKEVSEAPIPPV